MTDERHSKEPEGTREQGTDVQGHVDGLADSVSVNDVDALIDATRLLRTARLRQLGAARRTRRDS